MAKPTDHKVEVELVDVPLDSPMTACELAQLDEVEARAELAFLQQLKAEVEQGRRLDELKLKAMLGSLGLRLVDESDGPDILFVGEIDTSIDGIYERWEAIVSRHPIQHGKFSEPLLSEVFETAS